MILKKSYLAIFTLLFVTMQAFAQENNTDNKKEIDETASSTTNESQDNIIDDILKKLEQSYPKNIKMYGFNPVKNKSGHIIVHEFNDLSCYGCLKTANSFYKSLKSTDEIKVIYKNMYAEDISLTKQTALYGIIANINNKFWQFKDKIINLEPKNNEDLIKALTSIGITEKTIYDELMLNADKYYKQLDADHNLLKYDKNKQLPLIFVNGYQVGLDLTEEEAIEYLNYLSDQEHIKQEKEQNKYKIGKF